jgi:hypothetical protein
MEIQGSCELLTSSQEHLFRSLCSFECFSKFVVGR